MIFFSVNNTTEVKRRKSAGILSEEDRFFLEQIFESQVKRMWFISIEILQNKEMAEDNVQETFLNLIKRVSSLRLLENEDAVNGYVYIATKNTAISLLRKNKIRQHIDIEKIGYSLTDLKTNVEQEVLIREDIKLIHQKIENMKPSYRDAIYLRHFLHLRYSEIAEITHTTINGAMLRVSKGLKEIRKAAKRSDLKE